MTRHGAARATSWTGGAFLFSGRPDPSWVVTDAPQCLLQLFKELRPTNHAPPEPSRLGYRGAWLRAPDGRRWIAHEGIAWLEGTADIRADEGRRFEQAVLATAGPDALPKELLESL
jgi:hypothetical protein